MTPPRSWIPWALMLPGLIAFIGFLAIPLVMLFETGFHPWSSSQGELPGYTLQHYVKFLTDPFYLGILWRTVKVALTAVLTTLILGYPVAYVLSQTKGRARAILTLAVLSPLLISMVVRTYGWMIILANNGPVDRLLKAAGIENPPKLLYSEAGMIIGLTHIFVPYMILSIASVLERIDPAVIRAATNLGANQLVTFFRVVLPLSLPGIMSGSVIVFSLTSSAFVTPSMLGGPQVKVMSFLTYDQVTSILNWPFASAISFILMATTAGLLIFYSRILERGRYGVIFK